MNSIDTLKSPRELRRFGLTMGLPLALVSALLTWRGRAAAPYFTSLAVLFLLAAAILPRLLQPVERAWMAFAAVLGVVSNYILLSVSFYLVITPMALVLRLLRKDILALRFEPDKPSYWAPLDPDGPQSRPQLPY